ncbi:endonuclease/exonuclease/phosphatase family protein [Pseudonocardia sp. CA-107938]|uniref:endonuclease/exonuclease/phosphatase family protein n=1 Tax=Pseudonocardia sp. CA-107938 TaxID=3240021 RepID=UPI003D928D79
MREVTLLTFNVLSPGHADWPRRRAVIREGLRRLAPDVVALQECAHDVLDADYATIWHSRRSDDGVGAVLASRYPLRQIGEVDLRVTPRVTLPWAAAVLAEVELPLGTLVVAHHKPTWEHGYAVERELQAVACARAVEEHLADRALPAVVLGDFDDTPDSAAVRFWTGQQSLHGTSVCYRDAWAAVRPDRRGHTFDPRNPLVRAGEMALELGRRIDYVLVRSGIHGPALDVVDCTRVFDEPVDGVWASDHIGVLARLRVPDHLPGAWV